MIEKLPNDCALLLDIFANALNKDAKLGFCIETTSTKNKYYLAMCINDNVSMLKIAYDAINVSHIGKTFNAVWPYFIFKPQHFISIDDLCNKFNLDRNDVARAIFIKLKQKIKAELCLQHKYYDCIKGVNIYTDFCIDAAYMSTPFFKSFTEFLIWIDLNVN